MLFQQCVALLVISLPSLLALGTPSHATFKQLGEYIDIVAGIEEADKSLVSSHSRALLENFGSITQVGETIFGDDGEDLFGIRTDVSYDGSLTVVGAPSSDLRSGYAKVFKLVGDYPFEVEQVGSTLHGEGTQDKFGSSVAMDRNGRIIAVGAPRAEVGSDTKGHARVFMFNGTDWEQLGNTIIGDEEWESFGGSSLDLSDDGLTVAVGAHTHDDGGSSTMIGSVRVFKYNSTFNMWDQQGTKILGDVAEDQAGYDLALSGDGETLVVGSRYNDLGDATLFPDAGHMRVFAFNGTEWEQVGRNIDGEEASDRFGSSVAISNDGTKIAGGATHHQRWANDAKRGHVRVFQRNTTSPEGWSQVGGDIYGEAARDQSGISLSMTDDGNTIIIGATYNDGNGTNAGHARVFTFDACENDWRKVGGSDIEGLAPNDQAGLDSSISGDGRVVVVGSRLAENENDEESAGNLRIFSVIYAPLTPVGEEIVGQGPDDHFAISTAVSHDGEFVVVGASGSYNNITSASNRKGYTKVYKRDSTSPSSYSQLGQTIFGESDHDRSGADVGMSRDGSVIAIGAYNHTNDNGKNVGHIRVYALQNGNQWVQRGEELEGDNWGDKLGKTGVAVSDDGTVVAVGAMKFDYFVSGTKFQNIGVVKVFKWSGSAWVQEGLDILGQTEHDEAGQSVAMNHDGSCVAVGDNGLGESGQVRVFKRDTTHLKGWRLVGQVLEGGDGDNFGYSVGMNQEGTRIVIGALKEDTDTNLEAGAAHVYHFNEDTQAWGKVGSTIEGTQNNGYTGVTVSMTEDGNTVTIGSSKNNVSAAEGNNGGQNAGVVKIFTFNEITEDWVQVGCDINGVKAFDQAGYDSAISGDGSTVVVGARFNDSGGNNAGHLRIFRLEMSAPLVFASAAGDPHFKTFSNDHFSYHGECDLVLMKSSEFLRGMGIAIHVRTTRVDRSSVGYSFISGAAVRIGLETFEVRSDGDLFSNGQLVSFHEGAAYSLPSVFSISQKFIGRKKQLVQYEFIFNGMDNVIRIRSNLNNGMVFVDVGGTFPNNVGLLGSSGEDAHKVLLGRDGVHDFTGEWNSFGEQWQVRDTEPNLFVAKREPQFPKGCLYDSKNSFLRQGRNRRRLMEVPRSEITVAKATAACFDAPEGHKKHFCIDDVMATGDIDLVDDPFYHS